MPRVWFSTHSHFGEWEESTKLAPVAGTLTCITGLLASGSLFSSHDALLQFFCSRTTGESCSRPKVLRTGHQVGWKRRFTEAIQNIGDRTMTSCSRLFQELSKSKVLLISQSPSSGLQDLSSDFIDCPRTHAV